MSSSSRKSGKADKKQKKERRSEKEDPSMKKEKTRNKKESKQHSKAGDESKESNSDFSVAEKQSRRHTAKETTAPPVTESDTSTTSPPNSAKQSPAPESSAQTTQTTRTPAHTITDPSAAQDAFTKYYMSKVATEFEEDLDKIRSARDFNDSTSLEILLEALRQGTNCFSKEERVEMGRRVLIGGS